MARKLSREQRKTHRARSARAEQRGLPAVKLEKPSKPPPGRFESARRESASADEDEQRGDASSYQPAPSSAIASIVEQIKRLPMSVKIASIAAVALAVVWLFSLAKKTDRAPESPPIPSASPGPLQAEPSPSAAERPQTSPTSVPSASAEPGSESVSPARSVTKPSASAKAPTLAQPPGSAGQKRAAPKPKAPEPLKAKPAAPEGTSENPY